MSEHKHEDTCSCGCHHDHEEFAENEALFEDGERKFITLELEDGTSQEFMVVQIFEACNEKQYIAVIPEDQVGSDDAEAWLYRFHEDEHGDPVLEVITDEEELDIACDAFDEFLDEVEFNEMLAEDEE